MVDMEQRNLPVALFRDESLLFERGTRAEAATL
jgi:hypothetical protein